MHVIPPLRRRGQGHCREFEPASDYPGSSGPAGAADESLCAKQTKEKRSHSVAREDPAWQTYSAVEHACLPAMCKTLGSNPDMHGKEKREEMGGKRKELVLGFVSRFSC